MASRTLSEERLAQLTELAHGWGKIVAEEAYGENGPGLDVDLATMDDMAFEVAQALSAGVCEELTRRQAQQMPEAQPCPVCGQECLAEPEDDSGVASILLAAKQVRFGRGHTSPKRKRGGGLRSSLALRVSVNPGRERYTWMSLR